MKHIPPIHPTPIGTTQNTLAQISVIMPFSAYQKPRPSRQKSRKKLVQKDDIKKNFTSEQEFAKANQVQQLLLMQEMWFGESRDTILQALFHKNIEVVTFVHWLAVPSLGVVMSFSHQTCEKVEWL